MPITKTRIFAMIQMEFLRNWNCNWNLCAASNKWTNWTEKNKWATTEIGRRWVAKNETVNEYSRFGVKATVLVLATLILWRSFSKSIWIFNLNFVFCFWRAIGHFSCDANLYCCRAFDTERIRMHKLNWREFDFRCSFGGCCCFFSSTNFAFVHAVNCLHLINCRAHAKWNAFQFDRHLKSCLVKWINLQIKNIFLLADTHERFHFDTFCRRLPKTNNTRTRNKNKKNLWCQSTRKKSGVALAIKISHWR